jgi:predicted HTH domain antitoxin
MYKNKELSIGRAAEIAGLNIIQFREILSDRGLVTEVGSNSVEELDKNVRKLFIIPQTAFPTSK